MLLLATSVHSYPLRTKDGECMQQSFQFCYFFHDGIHSVGSEWQTSIVVCWIEYSKDRPYRSLLEALQGPILLCT